MTDSEKCPECGCTVIWDVDCEACDGSQEDEAGNPCDDCSGLGVQDHLGECSECGIQDDRCAFENTIPANPTVETP